MISQYVLSQQGSINFTLHNYINDRDQGGVIYKTEDPDYNQLALSISNQTSQTISLPNIDPAQADLTKIPIVIQMDSLLAEEIKAIKITQGKLNGKAIALQAVLRTTEDGALLLCIAPTQAQVINAKSTLEITFQNVVASDSDKDGYFNITLPNDKWPYSVPFALQYPPEPDKHNLLESASISFVTQDYASSVHTGGHHEEPDVVYICGSEEDCTDDLRDNALILSIQNTTAKSLAEGATADAYFSLSFPCSPNPKALGALATKADLTYTELALGQGAIEKWRKEVDDIGKAPVYKFYFQPNQDNTAILGIDDNATIHFILNSIKSSLPAGESLLHLAWHNLPGYNDGLAVLPIFKEPARPTIKKFELTKNPYTALLLPTNIKPTSPTISMVQRNGS